LELLYKIHEQLDRQSQELTCLREQFGEEFKDLRQQLREEFKDLRHQLDENFAMIISKLPKE
jgi:hypothetical protein